jgi:GNAT superfamily N-acetyltransferase
MEIERCSREDFAQILTETREFWGNERTLPFHHPMFIYEFGDTAFVIRDGSQVAAYLFAFITCPPDGERVAYAHLVGVREGYRRRGLGRRLYRHLAAVAAIRGCTRLKAISAPSNRESIAFHTGLGMEMQGEAGPDCIPLVRDYSGPGIHRVVFSKGIEPH